MKKIFLKSNEGKSFKRIVGGTVIATLFLTTSVFAFDQWKSIEDNLSQMSTEEEYIEYFGNKNFEELIEEINVMSNHLEDISLIYSANALLEKTKDVSPEKIIEEIQNESNSEITRVTLIQINNALGNAEINDALIYLLDDEDTNFEIKRNILLNSTVDENLYETVADSNDSELAFQAILMLEIVAPEKANVIANEILDNFTGEITDQVCAAYLTKGKYLKANSSGEERKDFIELGDKMLKSLNKVNGIWEEEVIADTIVFSISNMMSKEGISYIIENKELDSIVKVGAIDQNYSVLKGMLTKGASEKDIDIVIEAMKIFPINEMVSSLEDELSIQRQKRSAESQELVSELEEVIEYINNEGVNANQRYN